MIKKEIAEIKRQFTPANCSISRICGCYVDGEKNKKAEFKEAFLSLPEEDMFKYFELLRKNLSGTLGKNLINLEFPLAAEEEGGPHEFLLKLRGSRLQDDALLDAFYDHIIENYDYVGNYLILLIHDVYDIPGKTSDGIEMEDASDEVYSYILCSICPVDLSKPGLSYNELEGSFQNRIRDWVVQMPQLGASCSRPSTTAPPTCTAPCTTPKTAMTCTTLSLSKCLAARCRSRPVTRKNPSRLLLRRPWGMPATTRR